MAIEWKRDEGLGEQKWIKRKREWKRATGLPCEKPTAECEGCSGGGGHYCRRGPTDRRAKSRCEATVRSQLERRWVSAVWLTAAFADLCSSEKEACERNLIRGSETSGDRCNNNMKKWIKKFRQMIFESVWNVPNFCIICSAIFAHIFNYGNKIWIWLSIILINKLHKFTRNLNCP